jgi:hypothetical protein
MTVFNENRLTGLMVLLAVLVFNGCATVPFSSTERVSVDDVDPEVARMTFQDGQPGDYQLINTIVFRYRWHTQAAVGYLTVEHAQDRFALAAMTHMGVKLLELQGSGGRVKCSYALAEFSEHLDDVAAAIGLDIRHMYFNSVPSRDALVEKKRREIIYTERTSSGLTEFIFAGQQPVLIEKRLYEQGKRICRVRYYEYQSRGQKMFPGGILLENDRHGYRLEVHLKEIISMDSSERMGRSE